MNPWGKSISVAVSLSALAAMAHLLGVSVHAAFAVVAVVVLRHTAFRGER